MKSTMTRLGWSVACALVLMTARVDAQETLATARELYSAAAYEDALRVLDRLESGSQPEDQLAIHQYRAFCFLALGRTSDAERAIETVVSTSPSYHPSGGDVSPRVRAAFSAVRQRVLPSVVQQTYAQAKRAFDRKDFASAAAGFGQVLDVLADPQIGYLSSHPPLSDLGTLAVGFRELSVRGATPTPIASQSLVAPGAVSRPAAVAPRIYAGESNVVRPVTVMQDLPPFPRNIGPMRSGVLEIVIDEAGMVEDATIRSSINPRYDVVALEAVRSWRYKPATLNGKPVKFRKTIVVNIKPQQ
jgi:TonB family protein